MGWERRTKKPHTCNLPDAWKIQRRSAEVGDMWRCLRCGARWELKYAGIASTKLIGPATEPRWVQPGSPEDVWPEDYEPLPAADPPRQTGTDWLYSVQENKAR